MISWKLKKASHQIWRKKLKEWYAPHAHAQAESRLVLEGQAYYDIEDCHTEKWLRVLMEKGDFIVIPAGCLHRFTTDTTNFVKVKRFYQTHEGEPHCISKINCHLLSNRFDYMQSLNATTAKTLNPNKLSEKVEKVEAVKGTEEVAAT